MELNLFNEMKQIILVMDYIHNNLLYLYIN